MKKILLIGSMLLAMTACREEYTLDTNFAAPQELKSPAPIQLDVTSTTPVVLSWTGGGSEDGGSVLYEVLFDKESGDFSQPIATMKSDLGALPMLTLTQAQLNGIARTAGIAPLNTGTIKWTVNASLAGAVKRVDQSATITVTRGEGIDDIPATLYLYGSGAETEGQAFRCVEEGVFQIYAKLNAGTVSFKSATLGNALNYFINESNSTLRKGDGETTVAASAANTVTRLTVNFNTLQMTTDAIGTSVRCIWGATYNDIAVLNYTSGGKFVGDGDIRFLDPANPATNPPSWLGWIEERYYFIAKVNGGDKCWGRADDVSAERPTGGEPASFYALNEFAWTQWDHLWKMKGSLNNTHATITIDTNADGLMMHTFTNVTPI